MKFYTTPVEPPAEASGYKEPRGIRPIVNIGEELDEMARDLAESAAPVADAGAAILDNIRDRSYTDYTRFRADLTAYLDRIQERNAAMANATEAGQSWREAAQWLKEDYWRGFLFDPDSELAGYMA